MEDGMNRLSIGIVNNAHRLIDNPWITRCLNSERNGHGSKEWSVRVELHKRSRTMTKELGSATANLIAAKIEDYFSRNNTHGANVAFGSYVHAFY